MVKNYLSEGYVLQQCMTTDECERFVIEFTEEAFEEICDMCSIENEDFKLKAFQKICKVKFLVNSRLRRSNARYTYEYVRDRTRKIVKEVPHSIEIGKKTLFTYNKEAVVSILKHEVVHMILHSLELPFGDGTKLFEDFLAYFKANTSWETIDYNLYRATEPKEDPPQEIKLMYQKQKSSLIVK